MAKTPKHAVPAVIRDLLQHPQHYSFEQSIFLLRLWLQPTTAKGEQDFIRTVLRFRPALSLGFPSSDIENIELVYESDTDSGNVATADDTYTRTGESNTEPLCKVHITGTFYGLYGVTSPLPKFYTERLLSENAQDRSAMRDFLDIFNNQIYMLHTMALAQENPWYAWKVDKNENAEHMLMALASYGDKSLGDLLPDKELFLRYARLFFRKIRSTVGLRDMLMSLINWEKIRIYSNVLRSVCIPQEQRFYLGIQGTVLGEETTLGTTVPCYTDKILLEFYDVDMETHYKLRPQCAFVSLVHSLIMHYSRDLTSYAVTIRLLAGQARALCLGGYGSYGFATLGHNTWLGFGGINAASPLPAVETCFEEGF